MEPALKQRLLGAAVLIALAVIFLPMFFTGAPPVKTEQKLDLGIPPEPGAPMQRREFQLPLPGAADSNVANAATAAKPSGALPMVDVDHAPRPAASATTTANSTATVPVPDATPAANTPVATAPPAPTPAAPVNTVTAAAAPAAAPKPTATAAPVVPGTAAAQRYLVSVGVFGNHATAKTRLATVKKLGYDGHLESVPVNGKPATGVRVGPFNGRASAEAARLKLQDALAGVQPTLIVVDGTATAAPRAAAPSAPPSAVASGWAVQLAALRSRSDADAMAKRVKAAGFEAFVDDTRGADGTWWRVRVGPRAQRADADQLAAAIKARLHMAAIVVAHP